MTLTSRAIWLLAAGVLLAWLPGASALWAIGIYAGLVLAAAVADALTLRDAGLVSARRAVPDRLAIGCDASVILTVRNGMRRPAQIELLDQPPPEANSAIPETPYIFRLPPAGKQSVEYFVRPMRRGELPFDDLYIRIRGALGLVRKTIRVRAAQVARVLPDITEVRRFDLVARRMRMPQAGVRTARLQGVGRDFESLREYRPDDEMRQIDWKATARRNELVSRQYEVERGQNIILVIDCGRTMMTEIHGIQKLDHAINAALVLADVALRAEDRVGVLVFDDAPVVFLPPRRGRAQIVAIQTLLHNVEARMVEPDYATALAYLRQRWRQRSLLICFTDFWDADSARTTIDVLAAQRSRHLVAAVTLLDDRIAAAAHTPVHDASALFRRAVAVQVLDDRRRASERLNGRGVITVDAPAAELTATLVTRYQTIKSRELL